MSVTTHTHLCGGLADVQVYADADGFNDVYLTLRAGDHRVTISDDPDKLVALLQRMQDAVADAQREGNR